MNKENNVNKNFINKSKQYWDTNDLYQAMFERIYIDPANNKKTIEEKIEAWNISAEDSANQILGGIPYNSSWKALEIGCGIGRVIKPLRKKMASVDGIDIAENMIVFAKEYLTDCADKGSVWVNNGYDIAFLEDNSYDLVYSIIVFQHIRSASVINNYLKEIMRILKPGGFFKIQVFDNSKPQRGKFNEEAMDGIDYGLMGNGYSPDEFKLMLSNHNFEILNTSHNSPWLWGTCQKPLVNINNADSYLVSAIVSTYNSEKYIRYCLDDLLNQTLYKKGLLEIVIVNSASEQNESSIIQEYQTKYQHIVLIEAEKRVTLYRAWNIAIDAASGKYITNANTDDGHRFDAFEIMSNLMENNGDIDLVYAHSKITGIELQLFDECEQYKPLYNPEFSAIETLLHYQFGPQPMWRKDLRDKIGFFDEQLKAVGDYDFNIRFALGNCKAKLIPDLLGIYYQNPDSITNSFAGQKEEKAQLLQKYRTYENILKLYQNCGYKIESKEKQSVIFDDQAAKAISYYAAGGTKRRSDFVYASFCSKISNQLKEKTMLKVAVLAQANNLNFMQNLIPEMQKRFNLYIANCYDNNDLSYAYSWSDVLWLEWFSHLAHQIITLPKRCRIVARVHAYEVFKSDLANLDYTKIDALIFLAKNVKDYFLTKVPNLPKSVQVMQISGGLDLQKFAFSEHCSGFNLAFVASLTQTKNIALLMQILKMLVLEDSRYNLHVFGEYSTEGDVSFEIPECYMKNIISEMRLENNVTFYGYVHNSEFCQLMKNMNYIISTSFREGLTYNISEAMGMGIKPLIHNWPGAKSNYPAKYIFNYIGEIKDMVKADYDSREYREYVEKYHDFKKACNYMINVVKGDRYDEYGFGIVQDLPSTQLATTTQNTFFSICIFTYNRADMLGQAIESAINIDYDDFEIVIVDDGSTDNTEQVVNSFNSDKIRYFRKEHSNIPDSRNRCIKEAFGDYVLWLASDDVLDSKILKAYNVTINQYPDADILFCNQIIFDEKFRVVGGFNNVDWYEKNRELLKYFFLRNPLADGGSIIKKNVYRAIGNYDFEFNRAQDFEFWSRVAMNGNFKIKHVNQTLYYIRFHKSNLTGSKKRISTDFHYEVKVLNNIIKHASLDEIYFDVNFNNADDVLKVYQEVTKRYLDCNGLSEALRLAKDYCQKFPASEDGLTLFDSIKQRKIELTKQYSAFKTLENRFPEQNFIKEYLTFLIRNLNSSNLQALPVFSYEEAFGVIKEYAVSNLNSGSYDEAICLFNALLLFVPGNSDLLLSVINLYLLNGNSGAAKKHTEDLLSIDKNNAEGLAILQKINEVEAKMVRFEVKPYILPGQSLNKNLLIDFVTWERHHYIHLLPIWQKLPDEFKGRFYIICEYDSLEEFGINTNDSSYKIYSGLGEKAEFEKSLLLNKGPIVTASIFSQHLILGGVNRPIFCVEHGAGQTYLGMEHYLKERNNVYLDLLPGEQVKEVYNRRFPLTKKEVVGGPLLDKWHKGFTKPQNLKPVIAISFHFERDTVPETRSSYEFYEKIIPEIASDGRWTLIGHGHPRIIDRIIPLYKQYNIEIVRDFDEVMQRADLYICDNSSTIYEFASTDRPVVVLNAPWYRKEVEHGLRFWQFADVGVICNNPDELKKAISLALTDEPKQQHRRREVIRAVYAYTDGNCSARAADSIVKHALELGKNNDFIYLPDDDPDHLVGFLNDETVNSELVKKMLLTHTKMLVEYLNRKTIDSKYGIFIEDIDFYFSSVCLLQAKLNDFNNVMSLIEDYLRINPAYLPFKIEFLKQNKDRGLKNSKAKPSPLISVIIPTYNRLDNLRKALQSVIKQSYSNFEVVVVNDCGEDVASVVQSFDDSRITYFNHKVNKGPAAARNSGLRLAKGEFVAYLDDDDLYYPDHLKTFLQYIQYFPEIDVFYTDAWEHYQKKIGLDYKTISKRVAYSIDFSRETLLYKNISPTLCFLHRKSIVEKYGFFDEHMKTHEDWDYWLRLSLHNNFMHIKKTTCEYTRIVDGNNLSNTQYPDFYRTAKLLFEKYPVEKGSQIQEVRDKILKNFEVKLGIVL